MKKIALVFALIASLIAGSAVSVMAKSLFNKRNGEAIVLGIIVNRIASSEQDRKNKRKADKRNEQDIAKNQAKIKMQAEKDAYARQKKLDDLRFQQEMENEKRYQEEQKTNYSYGEDKVVPEGMAAVIVLHDVKGRYKVEGDTKIFRSFEAVRKYALGLYPDRAMSLLIQEVSSVK